MPCGAPAASPKAVSTPNWRPRRPAQPQRDRTMRLWAAWTRPTRSCADLVAPAHRCRQGGLRKAAQAAQQAAHRGDPGGSLPSFEAITKGARLTAGEADTLLQGLETFAENKMEAPMFPGGKLIETKESYPFSQHRQTTARIDGQAHSRIREGSR